MLLYEFIVLIRPDAQRTSVRNLQMTARWRHSRSVQATQTLRNKMMKLHKPRSLEISDKTFKF
jgi:hypothetical protein